MVPKCPTAANTVGIIRWRDSGNHRSSASGSSASGKGYRVCLPTLRIHDEHLPIRQVRQVGRVRTAAVQGEVLVDDKVGELCSVSMVATSDRMRRHSSVEVMLEGIISYLS